LRFRHNLLFLKSKTHRCRAISALAAAFANGCLHLECLCKDTQNIAMKRILFPLLMVVCCTALVSGADPMATTYSFADCLGSAKPYVAPKSVAIYPDSLTPVFVNHVGRHGARFLSSNKIVDALCGVLQRADSAGVLSERGRRLLTIANYVSEVSRNRWGALDSLGMAEQRGIASRMYTSYPRLFANGRVSAQSSYAPRCVMSMYEFTHQLDRLNNRVNIATTSGPQNSALLRPFETNSDYTEWAERKEWEEPYNMMFETSIPVAPARQLVTDANFLSNAEAQQLSFDAYKMLAGLPAMGLSVDFAEFFTVDEMNALWSCENLNHYLRRTATTLSLEPAYVVCDLLVDLINTTDEAVAGNNQNGVMLRFAHAETLMPLLSLMHLHGCYYMTNYFDTVALHWRDFDVVPMSANLQMVLFKVAKGGYCVRFDLNEVPVPLIPNSSEIYVPWEKARDYLNQYLPPHLQI
jgi:hypothetical protein